MGVFDKIAEKNEQKAREELKKVLPDDEIVEELFIVKEDFCAFTNKRIVFVDKKLVSSKKTLSSVPFHRINFVALKRGGFFSVSKEVVIGAGGLTLEIDTWDTEQAYKIMLMINERI